MVSRINRTSRVRLAFEGLESRDLLAGDLGGAVSSVWLLASTARTRDATAPYSELGTATLDAQLQASGLSAAGLLGGGLVNQPPAGTDATIETLENTPYTFSAADFGFSDADSYSLAPTQTTDGPTAANVLVLYNTASAAGTEIANYYASVHPGVHLLGINGIDPNNEDITADDYLSIIRPQVLAALTSSIDVIVTTKGLPLRIEVTESALPLLSTYQDIQGNTRTVYGWQVFSSLESELARVDLIGNWQSMGDQGFVGGDQLSLNPYYDVNTAFSYAIYASRLTARLDGYTVADVTAAIDRAQLAVIGPTNHPGGPFYFLVDNDPSKSYAQYMDRLPNNVLIPDGMPTVYDNTSAFVGTAPGPVIGYDSHGVHQASTPANYLLTGLNITLADGAVFESWESYNAYSFNPSNPHGNQGQVAQWLQIGGTAGVGHVEEPKATVSTVTNEDQMFKMLIAGRTFAEAAWSGNRQVSFVNTVAGDPLMRWRALIPGGNLLAAVKISTLPARGTLTNNSVIVTAGQLISVADINAGLLKFTPALGASGAGYSSFTFQVQDTGIVTSGGGNLDLSPNTITINVTPVDDAPPVGFWRFDGGPGSTVGDASGNGNTATLLSGAILGAGQSGGGLLLSAANQRAVVADVPSLDMAGAITISAWIAPAKLATQTIVKKARSGAIDGYELSLSSSGKIFVRFNQDTSGDKYRLESTTKYPTNGSTWLHVAATYDGSTIRLYVNGQLQASKGATFTIHANNTALGIGAEDGGKYSLRGRIDDVLLAGRALSAAEISRLYQGDLPPGWAVNQAPTVSAGADVTTRLSNAATLAGSVADDGQPTGAQLTNQWTVVSGPGSVSFGNSSATATTATFSAVGDYVLRLTASDGALDAYDDVLVKVVADIAGIAGEWRFNELSGTTAADASGHGNPAALIAGAALGAGHEGNALLLAGSTQRAIVADAPSLDMTAAITLSAWIAPTAKATQAIIKKARSGSVDGYELSLSSSGKVFVRFNQDTSGDNYRLNSTISYPTNGTTWIHVVATYDGSTIRLYVNGQLQASKAATFTIHTNNTALGIGAEDGGKNSLHGRIDDVLVADRALSAAEINDLYQGA